ncbi:thermonuclease family protein [Carboxydothermus hydrogenoformans]|uniref:Putative thermonuclease n=1 Tax=Carboxydothermus hydrogenoformans (strain ATCC BAA-161 / DSM 6008 / Z-2901) TaxID=246194 RepID=Q3AA55_CARHZ|nr:thermonuclease family protein [Carboxydothermus hydrogenoformans]ABB14612.1 putative thermonuclease [Carboxydothermus hydrogenoformans Z-2901]
MSVASKTKHHDGLVAIFVILSLLGILWVAKDVAKIEEKMLKRTRPAIITDVQGEVITIKISGMKFKVVLFGIKLSTQTTKNQQDIKKYLRENWLKKPVWVEFEYTSDGHILKNQKGYPLVYIWDIQPTSGKPREAKEHMLNVKLLLNGYAQYLSYGKNQNLSPYTKLFLEMQDVARKNKIGIWQW